MYLRQLLTAATAVMLAGALHSCADNDLLTRPAHQTVITASIDGGDDDADTDSRTAIDGSTSGPSSSFLGVLWTSRDSIGVFGASATRNARFNNINGYRAKRADFGGTMAGGEEPLYAYYPWTADNNGKEPSALDGTVGTRQPFSLATGELTDDWKWGAPRRGTLGSDGGQTTSQFAFKHLFALARIEIDATGISGLEGEHLDYIDIEATGGEALAGSFTFSAIDGTWGNLRDTSSKIRMPWTDTPLLQADARYAGFVTLLPTLKADARLRFTVATDTKRATFEVGLSTALEQGKAYRFPLKLSLFANEAHSWKVTDRPTLGSLTFTVAGNEGKILDNKITGATKGGLFSSGYEYSFTKVTEQKATVGATEATLCIPYLYDFKLKPTFTVGQGVTVSAGGVQLESGKTEVDFSRPVELLLTSADGDERRYTVRVTNSGLPVVVVNQSASGDFSEESSGGLFSKTVYNKFVDITIRKKSSEWVEDDEITVYNADGTIEGGRTLKGGMRQRGNSTRKYPKKAMAIKLIKADKTGLLGMPSSRRWVLLANWIDHSLIRNAAAFAIAHTIEEAVKAEGLPAGISWNPHGRNVELVVDGHHMGNYLLAEQIKIEKNRVNISDSWEDVMATNPNATMADLGLLFELDASLDEAFSFQTSKSKLPVMSKDDEIGSSTALQNEIKNRFNSIDAAITGGDFTTAYNLYDIYSAIDQMLVNELTMNREYTEPRSVYYYIEKGGKLTAGPVWDFDRGTFHNPNASIVKSKNETNRKKPYDQWLFQFSTGNSDLGSTPGVWYRSLIADATFKATLKARWQVLKPWLAAYVPAEIERLYAENAVSWSYNDALWPTSEAIRKAGNNGSDFKDWSGDEEMTDYAKIAQNLIDCFNARLAGLDALIQAL